MAKIPVETLTDNCWEKCPEFEVEVDRIYSDYEVVFTSCSCIHIRRCREIIKSVMEDKNDR